MLRGFPGFAYIALNVGLGLIVLWLLRLASHPGTNVAGLQQVFLAGFGARVIVRTKVATWPAGGGKTEDIGPGAFFDRILVAISRAADRDRAEERINLVASELKGVAWSTARPLFVAEMAAAMQDLTPDEKKQISENVNDIDTREGLDDETRLDLLGYLVLDYAGEPFFKKLVVLCKERSD